MLPFKPRWSAFNDLGNRCAASSEAASQLQLRLVIKQHYRLLSEMSRLIHIPVCIMQHFLIELKQLNIATHHCLSSGQLLI